MKNKNIHQWDVLAISCIDGRFIKRTIDWILNEIGDVFDFRTEVGATKAIIDNGLDRERFFEVIRTSVRLHSIKEVWLFDHIDCGAYEGSGKHESAEAEKEFHFGKLKAAAEIINREFPDLKVRKLYVDWSDISEIE